MIISNTYFFVMVAVAVILISGLFIARRHDCD